MGLRATTTIFFLAGLCTVALETRGQRLPPQKEITYCKDVAPILNQNCVMCHRPNDVAPMSLMTYDEVLPFARMMSDSVLKRKMPPWHADPNVGEFMNELKDLLGGAKDAAAAVRAKTGKGAE